MRTINVSETVRVFVTSVTDYLSSWVIRLLLEEGFTIKGAVHAATDEELSCLKELGRKHENRLELVHIDAFGDDVLLLQEVLTDCDYIVHGAVFHPASVPQKDCGGEGRGDVLRPSLVAVKHVLDAAAGSPSIKRVILTCSANVLFDTPNDIREDGGHVWTEDDWNTVSTEKHHPYNHAEAEAEKFAWAYWQRLGEGVSRSAPSSPPPTSEEAHPPEATEEPEETFPLTQVEVNKAGGQRIGANFAGLMLTAVAPDTPAAEAGMEALLGRVITHVDGIAVTTFEELSAIVCQKDVVILGFGPLAPPEILLQHQLDPEQLQGPAAEAAPPAPVPLNPSLKPRTPIKPVYQGPRPHYGLTSIICTHAIGPPVGTGSYLNSVTGMIASMLNGAFPPPKIGLNVVDVRDCARAHMLAVLHDVADGRRYVVSNQTLWLPHLTELIKTEMRRFCKNLPTGSMWPLAAVARTFLPSLSVTNLCQGRKEKPSALTLTSIPSTLLSLSQLPFVSNHLVRNELGLPMTSLTDSLGDMVLGLVQHGFVEDTSGPPPVDEEEEYYYYFS